MLAENATSQEAKLEPLEAFYQQKQLSQQHLPEMQGQQQQQLLEEPARPTTIISPKGQVIRYVDELGLNSARSSVSSASEHWLTNSKVHIESSYAKSPPTIDSNLASSQALTRITTTTATSSATTSDQIQQSDGATAVVGLPNQLLMPQKGNNSFAASTDRISVIRNTQLAPLKHSQ